MGPHYQTALRELVFSVDGEERQAVPWPEWAITTVIDTSRVWPAVWRAVSLSQDADGDLRKTRRVV